MTMDPSPKATPDPALTGAPSTPLEESPAELIARARLLLARTAAAEQLVKSRAATAAYVGAVESRERCGISPPPPHVSELRRWVEVSEALADRMRANPSAGGRRFAGSHRG